MANKQKKHTQQPWFLINELDRFLKEPHSKIELELKKRELLSRYIGDEPLEFERDIRFSVLMHRLYDRFDETNNRRRSKKFIRIGLVGDTK